MNIFVLFGITGDLAKNRVIPALKKVSMSGDFVFIGAGRKPTPIDEFKTLPNNTYISGDLSDQKIYKKIADQVEKVIKKHKSGLGPINLILYSSLPPSLHTIVAENFSQNIKKVAGKYLKRPIQVLVEKPIGNSLEDAKKAINDFSRLESRGFEVKFVDHYLAKESLINIEQLFASNPKVLEALLPAQEIREIKAVIYEKEGIKDRGVFYDKIGALYDVGQNHLLQILSVFGVILNSGAKISHKSKLSFLKNLQIQGSPVFWQYKGYTEEKNIPKDSTTETFFSATFKLKNQKHNILYSMASGKALDMDKSGVEVHFHDNKPSIFIDLKNSSKDAYEIIFENSIKSDAGATPSLSIPMFATEEEVIESWKIVERLKKLKTKANLVVYKKLHDILG